MHRFLLPLLLVGCAGEYNVKNGGHTPGGGEPDIELSTTTLQFGPTAAGDSDLQAVTVTNVGTAPLTVSDLVITSGEQSFTVTTTPKTFVLDVNESTDVEVEFVPYLATNYGSLSILSDDPDEPDSLVDLLGIGLVPELALDPIDFAFPSGCEDTVYVTMTNVGNDTLTVSNVAYAGDAELSLESQLILPIQLEPGEEAGVHVRYLPTTQNPSAGTLSVTSDDPRGIQEATQDGTPGMSRITEQFITNANPPIDIIFALDKSGSMTSEMGLIANAFDDFILDIGQATSDWRIGVVSHQNGCFNNGIITPTTPYYADVFGNAVRGLQILGTDLTEALLELTYVALWETVPGGCNAGFARADAVLAIVAVSDEPDQSSMPWDFYVNAFQAAKADPALVQVSIVGDIYGSGCGTQADGYIEAAQATGGLQLDICTSNWGSYAAQLGAAAAQALRTFHLSAVPDPTSITVSMGGVSYTNGWHYDAALNAVVVDVEIPDGETLEISYDAVGC